MTKRNIIREIEPEACDFSYYFDDDETNEQLLKEIKAFYLAEIEAGNIDSESEPYIQKIVSETTV